MTTEEIKFVRDYINYLIEGIFEDNQEREKFIVDVLDDVITDIEECADKDTWCGDDVRIALARLILKTFQID